MVRLAIALWCCVAGVAGEKAASPLQEQSGGRSPAFAYDVVVIKPVKGEPSTGGYGDLPDGFAMRGLPLRVLINTAYGLRDDEISGGPGWVSSLPFDITAKMEPEAAVALRKLPKQEQDVQRRLMLQALLKERFRLQVHSRTEVRTTYELVIAKNGLKMKEDNAATDRAGRPWQEGVRPETDWNSSDGRISGHAEPMSILRGQLENAVGGIVTDETGLTGRYDVLLHWDPAENPSAESTELPLFPAVEEELGLRLRPVKTEAPMLVIEHVEMPSPN